MHANRCYWKADRNDDDLWVVEMREMGVFPDLLFRILPFDPMRGDEVGRVSCRGASPSKGEEKQTPLKYRHSGET